MDERGATVAESTVRAYVGRVRRELESGSTVVTIPQLHPPGEEAEVDFGQVSVWLDGVLTELSMFVIRLSHSGRAVHVCFPGEGQEALTGRPRCTKLVERAQPRDKGEEHDREGNQPERGAGERPLHTDRAGHDRDAKVPNETSPNSIM